MMVSIYRAKSLVNYHTYLLEEEIIDTRKGERKLPDVNLEEFAEKHLNKTVYEYVSHHLANLKLNQAHVYKTRNITDITSNTPYNSKAIVNFESANNFRKVNYFFEKVNSKLDIGGLFINNLEIQQTRKERILNTTSKPLNYLFYNMDFVLHRVIPKIKYINKVYFNLTKGYNRAITKAEAIGRLYSCGFEIVDYKTIDGKLYFAAKKVRDPFFDQRPTYGPLIYLRRVGRHGKVIKVAKLRTMHPYAEYLQEYLNDKNKDDFRVSTAGRLFRKYWIDELPMLINLIKGDIKLVGVRPLSKHYFSLYPKEAQQKRARFKPGLFPPFYVDMPKTLDEIVKSEEKYLDLYIKNPILTDLKYFFKIVVNIVFKGKRSA